MNFVVVHLYNGTLHKNEKNTATHKKKEIHNHKTEQREPYIILQYCMFYLQKVQNQVKVSSCDKSQESYQVCANFLLYRDPGGDCKSMFKSKILLKCSFFICSL